MPPFARSAHASAQSAAPSPARQPAVALGRFGPGQVDLSRSAAAGRVCLGALSHWFPTAASTATAGAVMGDAACECLSQATEERVERLVGRGDRASAQRGTDARAAGSEGAD